MIDHRRAMTLRYPHRVLGCDAEHCLYCGERINPFVFPSGHTRHLDHFIPVHLLVSLSRWYPDITIENVLVPSCRQCNGVLNGFVFLSLNDRMQYIADILRVEVTDPVTAVFPIEVLSLIEAVTDRDRMTDHSIIIPSRVPLATYHPGYKECLFRRSSHPEWVYVECELPKPRGFMRYDRNPP
jgi:hypothetical protein